jgi:AcrR family transcriptional regulator
MTDTAPPRVDDTSRALLHAAHDLLAHEGPEALTVRRIAAAAGMSTMNVYSRFGGKDGVLDHLFIDGFQRLGQAMDDVAPSDDPIEDLRRAGEAYRDFARRWPTYYSLMFDRAAHHQPSEAALATALATLTRLVHLVQRAMDAGAMVRGDAFAVAAGLWALQHGLVSLEARTEEYAGGEPTAGGSGSDWPSIATLTAGALLGGLRPGR